MRNIIAFLKFRFRRAYAGKRAVKFRPDPRRELRSGLAALPNRPYKAQIQHYKGFMDSRLVRPSPAIVALSERRR